MDISTLIADAVGPRSLELAGPVEQRSAIDTLIPLAEHSLRVFDHDLSEGGWNSAARADALRVFLLRAPSARLQLLLRDTGYLETRCPRLRTLLQRFDHAVAVHRCGETSLHGTDPMLIVDERHYIHRFHYQQPVARAGLFQDSETRSLIERFEDLWSDSEPAVPPTTLGL